MYDTLVTGGILEGLVFFLDSLLHDQRRSPALNFLMVLVLGHSHTQLTFRGAHVGVQMLSDSLCRASCGERLPRS